MISTLDCFCIAMTAIVLLTRAKPQKNAKFQPASKKTIDTKALHTLV